MIGLGDYKEAKLFSEMTDHDIEIHFRLPSRNVKDLQEKYGEIIADLSKYVVDMTPDLSNLIIMSINELVYNALKYRVDGTKVFVRIILSKGKFLVEVHNNITDVTKNRFIKYLCTLFTSDYDQLYYNQIHYLAHTPDAERACIGLLTLLRDFKTQLGYEVNEFNDKNIRVIAYALLQIKIPQEEL